jgi:hypothetical protein
MKLHYDAFSPTALHLILDSLPSTVETIAAA